MSSMSIKYNDKIYELTYSQFVIELIRIYNFSSLLFTKIKFKYGIYKQSKLTWVSALKLKNIFKDSSFVRDMYNCGKLDINDHDGFGWYSDYFKDKKIIP